MGTRDSLGAAAPLAISAIAGLLLITACGGGGGGGGGGSNPVTNPGPGDPGNPNSPADLSYGLPGVSYLVELPGTPVAPTWTGQVNSFSITPALPPG